MFSVFLLSLAVDHCVRLCGPLVTLLRQSLGRGGLGSSSSPGGGLALSNVVLGIRECNAVIFISSPSTENYTDVSQTV